MRAWSRARQDGTFEYNSAMKLYVCWGTVPLAAAGRPSRAGTPTRRSRRPGTTRRWSSPTGSARCPTVFNRSSGRKEVRRSSPARSAVPVLVTDDGEVIQDSRNIVAWAKENPAREEQLEAQAARRSRAG